MSHTEAMEFLDALDMVNRRLKPVDGMENFYCERIALVHMMLARHGRTHNANLWSEYYFQKERDLDFTTPKVRSEFQALLARAVRTLSSHEGFIAALGAEESRLQAMHHNLMKELAFMRTHFPAAEPGPEPIADPAAEPAADPNVGSDTEPNQPLGPVLVPAA